jgi:hypothetical protein
MAAESQQQQQQRRSWREKTIRQILMGLAMSVGMVILHFSWFVPSTYPNHSQNKPEPYRPVIAGGEQESPLQLKAESGNNNNNNSIPQKLTATNDETMTTKNNTDDENNDDNDSYTQSDYYQYKCRIGLLMPTTNMKHPILLQSNRSYEARALSIQENVLPYVHSILDQEILSGRKILFVGDSLIRQMSWSLACLAGPQRWYNTRNKNDNDTNTINSKNKNENTLQYPSIPECYNHVFCSQMHYQSKHKKAAPASNNQNAIKRLPAGTTTTSTSTTAMGSIAASAARGATAALEVYHSVHAGRLLKINSSYNSSWDLQQSWIDVVCNTTTTTTTTTHTTTPPPQYREGGEEQSVLYFHDGSERVPLGANDFVFLDGTHHNPREQNLERIVRLAKCLQLGQSAQPTTTQEQQQHYPQFAFVQYSPVHLDTENGEYQGKDGAPNRLCRLQSHPSQKAQMDREVSMIQQQHPVQPPAPPPQQQQQKVLAVDDIIMPVVGQVMARRAINLGRYHVNRGDCMHWLRPGVPDLFLKEILEWIVMRATHSTHYTSSTTTTTKQQQQQQQSNQHTHSSTLY